MMGRGVNGISWLVLVSPIIICSSVQGLTASIYLNSAAAPVACDPASGHRSWQSMVSSPSLVVVSLVEFSTSRATLCPSYHLNYVLKSSPAVNIRVSQLQHYWHLGPDSPWLPVGGGGGGVYPVYCSIFSSISGLPGQRFTRWDADAAGSHGRSLTLPEGPGFFRSYSLQTGERPELTEVWLSGPDNTNGPKWLWRPHFVLLCGFYQTAKEVWCTDIWGPVRVGMSDFGVYSLLASLKLILVGSYLFDCEQQFKSLYPGCAWAH